MQASPTPPTTAQMSSGNSCSTLHYRQSSITELPKWYIFFNPYLPPTHTLQPHSADSISLPTAQTAFHSLLRSAKAAASKTEAPQNQFSDWGKQTRKRESRKPWTYLWKPSWQKFSREAWAVHKLFSGQKKRRASSYWADRAAFFLQLRRAQQPGELLHRGEAREKPFSTSEYQSLCSVHYSSTAKKFPVSALKENQTHSKQSHSFEDGVHSIQTENNSLTVPACIAARCSCQHAHSVYSCSGNSTSFELFIFLKPPSPFPQTLTLTHSRL